MLTPRFQLYTSRQRPDAMGGHADFVIVHKKVPELITPIIQSVFRAHIAQMLALKMVEVGQKSR